MTTATPGKSVLVEEAMFNSIYLDHNPGRVYQILTYLSPILAYTIISTMYPYRAKSLVVYEQGYI